MSHSGSEAIWVPTIERSAGALYQSIADALERDVRSGRLAPGARLPAQRVLGEALGVDFTTVTRAYTEARRRGLIEGRAGHGTFVRKTPQTPEVAAAANTDGPVDMSMNLPPRFQDPDLSRIMWEDIASLAGPDGLKDGLDLLLQYHLPGGTGRDRELGANWLAPRIPGLSSEDVQLCSGAQGALFALFGALVPPGGTVLSADLTYPGMIAAAEQLRLSIVPIGMDAEGLRPDQFEAACLAHPAAVLYANPTLHNPTMITMPLARRKEIIDIARRHGVTIIEDDAYGAIAEGAPPPLRALAPDLVYHVAGLAKCLSPALRLAYIAMPVGRSDHVLSVERAIRATAAGVSSLSTAIAAKWIATGTAARITDAIRDEARKRHKLGLSILPEVFATHPPEAFHLWLPLSNGWDHAAFGARLHSAGVGVVGADAFALSTPPEAVRISLGATRTAADLERGLNRVSAILKQNNRRPVFVV